MTPEKQKIMEKLTELRDYLTRESDYEASDEVQEIRELVIELFNPDCDKCHISILNPKYKDSYNHTSKSQDYRQDPQS
jgi:hypothetical protein